MVGDTFYHSIFAPSQVLSHGPAPTWVTVSLLLLGDTTLEGLITSTVKWKLITASINDTGTINF